MFELIILNKRINGGVSHSNFLCNYLAQMLQFDVERSSTSYESSTYGSAFLSALGSKAFTSLKDLLKFRKEPEVFHVKNEENHYINNFHTWENDLYQWKKCVKSFMKF